MLNSRRKHLVERLSTRLSSGICRKSFNHGGFRIRFPEVENFFRANKLVVRLEPVGSRTLTEHGGVHSVTVLYSREF